MKFNSPNQLKDWLRNKEISEGIPANTLLNYYMMERFLERIAKSQYKDNFIFKGGFLISSLIGINLRSTLDIDATLKDIKISKDSIMEMIDNILGIELDDNVLWKLSNIRSIHKSGKYEDYRISLEGRFFNIIEHIKIDITTGDKLIPREVEYSYDLMFEDRAIDIRAYHLYTVLSEKIETILSRNIANTRARDFYDVYILTKLNKNIIVKEGFMHALESKFVDRDTIKYLELKDEYLSVIRENLELKEVWRNYQEKYKYAKDINWEDIIKSIENLIK